MWEQFKNVRSRCRPERVSRKVCVLRAIGPKGPHLDFLGVGVGAVQKFSQPMPVGKGKPNGCVLRAIGPKGPNVDFLWVCVGAVQNFSQPMPAGKDKPKGCVLRAVGSKGPNRDFLGVGRMHVQKPCRPISPQQWPGNMAD